MLRHLYGRPFVITTALIVSAVVVHFHPQQAAAQGAPVDCGDASYASTRKVRYILERAARYEQKVLAKANAVSPRRRYPSYECNNGLRGLGKVYCRNTADAAITGRLRKLLGACKKLYRAARKATVAGRVKRGAPTDPTRLDCSSRWYQSYLKNYRVNSLLSYIQRDLAKIKAWSSSDYPLAECSKLLKQAGTAKCKWPNDPQVTTAWNQSVTSCRSVYKREAIAAEARAFNRPLPMSALTPAQARSRIKSELGWARTYSRRQGDWPKAMVRLRMILKLEPRHAVAGPMFDTIYAGFFGVSEGVAKGNRLAGRLDGRLSVMPKAKLHRLAIDELLGKHHKVVGDSPKLGLPYLDVYYLTVKLFEPLLAANKARFGSLVCSQRQRRGRRDFTEAGVAKALTSSGACVGKALALKKSQLVRDPRVRMAMIKILAAALPDADAAVKAAAKTIAGQVGAPRSKVCWLWENPYPESIKPSAGPKAHCSKWGTGSGHNMRPGYYNFVYTPKPMKRLTRLEIWEARSVLAMAGLRGSALDKKYVAAKRRAKATQCVAFEVLIDRRRKTASRMGPMRFSGVGGNKVVPCGRVRRNGGITRLVPKHWNNFFDKVIGAKWKGGWKHITGWYRTRRRMYKKVVRHKRTAIIYVRRKI